MFRFALEFHADARREGQIGSVPGAALPLTVATLAVVHHHRFGRDFKTDRAAGTSAGISLVHRLYSQLSSLISFGAGAPFPVSSSDFRLSRKTPHLVLQWCMNSTGSFQPRCVKRTMVQSASCLRSKLTFVPIHSAGPSTTCHSTRLAGSSSRTFMSMPPGPKRNSRTPPTLASPWVLVVHQPERPSRVVK